jgi:L-lactate dehydrogenase (cytochrome)
MRRGASPSARAGAKATAAAAAAAPPAPLDFARVRELAAAGRAAMVVEGVAYDFTDFLADHPGGPAYLRRNAGKDATAEFVASHPADIIARTLSGAQAAAMTLGPVDAATITASDVGAAAPAAAAGGGGGDHGAAAPGGDKPSLDHCINVMDFEAIANSVTTEQAWAYYSSGADDEITLRENHNAFHRLWLRPRVMVNVRDIDMRTTILGSPSAFPVFLSAVAMCKLGHPDGEVAWTRAAGKEGVIYMVPTLSGCATADIFGAAAPAQPMFFQLYVNSDRAKTETIVRKAEALGARALFITCDAPQLGNREKDRRVKVSHAGAAVQAGATGSKAEGTSKALTTFIDPSLCWADLPWFRSITKMKIVLKGVGTREDAVLALEAGMDGVLLSNHGGRQLDFARSGLEVLPETMAALRAHPLYNAKKFEVYVDGGVRRGSDIFKALALGATAVGIGRPALYAMSSFGTEGVAKVLQILKSELEMTMRLMGTPTLRDIVPGMVITDHLSSHIAPVPSDFLQAQTYVPAVTQAQRNRFGRAGAAALAPAPAAAAAPVGDAPANLGAGAIELLKQLGLGLARGIFTPVARLLVHRTSLVLCVFMGAHAAGNALFFLGPDTYNAYGQKLHGSVAIRAVEVYLLLAGAAHVLSGAFLTLKDGKLAPPRAGGAAAWATTARLALTGSVLAAFVVMHLQHLRFGASGAPATRTGARDLHADVVRTLADARVAVLYAAAALAVGAHTFWGWEKAARKMKSDGAAAKPVDVAVRVLGQGIAVAMTGVFLAVTAAAHMQSW